MREVEPYIHSIYLCFVIHIMCLDLRLHLIMYKWGGIIEASCWHWLFCSILPQGPSRRFQSDCFSLSISTLTLQEGLIRTHNSEHLLSLCLTPLKKNTERKIIIPPHFISEYWLKSNQKGLKNKQQEVEYPPLYTFQTTIPSNLTSSDRSIHIL